MKLSAFLFYLVVLIVGGLYFYSNAKSVQNTTISSTIPEINPKLINSEYLNKKLGETGFWREQNVTIYNKPPLKSVTVKKLSVILTDKPQTWGRTVDNAEVKNPHVLLSYGQEYDSNKMELKLFIHVDRSTYSKNKLSLNYSGQLLFAAYDMTHHYYTGQNNNRFVELEPYLADFKKNPEKNIIVQVQQ